MSKEILDGHHSKPFQNDLLSQEELNMVFEGMSDTEVDELFDGASDSDIEKFLAWRKTTSTTHERACN